MGKVVMSQRKSDSIVVTGLGMISSIGRDVVTSCASARAGITRESELDYFSVFDEESVKLVPVVGHAITGFSEGFVGLGRLICLGAAALADLLTYTGLKDMEWDKTGFFLNLSSGYYMDVFEVLDMEESGFMVSQRVVRSDRTKAVEEEYRTDVIPLLLNLNEISIPERNQMVYFKDHHGVIAAIQDAVILLRQGVLDRCIIGGIDSYVEPDILQILESLALLKTSAKPAAFLPGEAAAFFMIERYDRACLRKGKIEGILEAPAIASESCHRFSKVPSVGVALSEAIESAFVRLHGRGNEVGLIISNLNGDPWMANEWGNCMSRISTKHAIREQPQWCPPLSLGETGAATGAIAICMGVRGFVRGYAKTNLILVSMSSYNGSKACVTLRNVN